jgi:alkyldihydroxyacetonephosphate synthase
MSGDRRVITLDLAKLDRVLCVDELSHTARIQAGATGPEIEAQLNPRGFTLGHFPQSFEFSTLGGWIATRSAGQNCTGYGRIQDMTQAVRAVTPVGVIETKETATSAAGPSLLQVLVGSEGAYGVIIEATMRICPLPAVRDYRGILFHGLEDGINACRELVQSTDLRPSIVRLSDASESAAYVVMSHSHQGLRRLANGLFGRYLQAQGYDQSKGNGLLLVLGFDGEAGWVGRQWNRALDLCGDYHGLSMGRAVGQSWMRDRYAQPHLRDALLDHGIMMDTVGTATTWANLMRLYEALITAVRGAISANGGGPGYVMVHISHACEQGASVCATFLGRQVDDPDPLAKQEQWREVKKAAIDTIIAAGGTLTHHHGIGRDHTPWLRDEVGPLGVESLSALKDIFDPLGIMSPGILLPSQASQAS